ncbi:amidohydrolase family protein [Maribacter sp. MJ134]|uniref:amidohydrolase family protein n=1 Tax=Maribacter sp. MJ134 TaxID=2496865 RepID=UPI0013E05D8B|nr:amidohydrolase family protein [Maribacter sp. MJ134]
MKKYYEPPEGHYSYTQRNKRWSTYQNRIEIKRNPILKYGLLLIKILTWVAFVYYFLQAIKPLFIQTIAGKIIYGYVLVPFDYITYPIESTWNILVLLFIIALTFKFVRNGLWKMLKSRFIKIVGKDRLEYLLRFENLLRYANYNSQGGIFSKLTQQYPPNTQFVVLPMDMEYMDADIVPVSYLKQMDELIALKNISKNKDVLLPFVFVDPRRIEKQTEIDPFFKYDDSSPDEIKLENCRLKTYLDDGACGIKIYPALGYYPFDKKLLPLWLYCAQNEIPITTHCSVGPIFYRGDKKVEWDRHPIFEEVISNDENGQPKPPEKLRLQQIRNIDFQANFTHPLNYTCLLIPEYLKSLLELEEYQHLQLLFGYSKEGLKRDLSNLKINLAHYGGSENWDEFLAKDREQEANEIFNNPTVGLNLKKDLLNLTNLYRHWHYTEWFSLISSMIIEFDNVYTDISYTTHENKYLNLLSEILNNPEIKDRVLFGTDFYVVSNQKTEKQYWIDMKNMMGDEKWNSISYKNPKRFLYHKVFK